MFINDLKWVKQHRPSSFSADILKILSGEISNIMVEVGQLSL